MVRYLSDTRAVVANRLELLSTSPALTVLGGANLGAGSSPFGVTLNPARTRAYLTGRTSPGRVFVVDVTTNPPTLITSILVGNDPQGIVYKP